MKYIIKATEEIAIVTTIDEFGYDEVIDSFDRADYVRIITYNISSESGRLQSELENLDEKCELTLVTNIPNRFNTYYSEATRNRASKVISKYIESLEPSNYDANTSTYFNFKNHSKIIMTNEIAYIGSANYSDASSNNIESGVIFRNKQVIERINEELIPIFVDSSIKYFGSEDTRILVLVSNLLSTLDTLYTEFHYSFFAEYGHSTLQGKEFYDSNNAYLEHNTILKLNNFLDDAQNIIDEISQDERFSDHFKEFDLSRFENIQEFIKEDTNIYEFSLSDEQHIMDDYMEEHLHAAYDENLDYYAQQASQTAHDIIAETREEIKDDVCYIDRILLEILYELKEIVASISSKKNDFSKVDNT